jgi:cytidine deaminase
MQIDWLALRAGAADVAGRAYAPYSRLRVGAAGLTGDGLVVTGCNVENASFGLTLCAECGLVSALHATPTAVPGGAPPVLVAVAVVAGDGEALLPCGRCRQLLLEAGGRGPAGSTRPRGRSPGPTCSPRPGAARTCRPAGNPARRPRRSRHPCRRSGGAPWLSRSDTPAPREPGARRGISVLAARPGERNAGRRVTDSRQAR